MTTNDSFARQSLGVRDRLRRQVARCGAFLVAVLALGLALPAQSNGGGAGNGWLVRETPYPERTIEAFERLPVQDHGRIKPFLTYARFLLIQFVERSELAIPDEAEFGELADTKLGPVEWALDIMLFPQQAEHYPMFAVTDRDLFDRLERKDIAASKRKRDRYSFDELRSALVQIEDDAKAKLAIDVKQRDRLDGQLIDLYNNLRTFVALRGLLDAARMRLPVEDSELLVAAFGSKEPIRYSTALGKSRQISMAARQIGDTDPELLEPAMQTEAAMIAEFTRRVIRSGRAASAMAWLPPGNSKDEDWLDNYTVFDAVWDQGPEQLQKQIQALGLLEKVADGADLLAERGEHGALASAAEAFVTHTRSISSARQEGPHLETEVSYYRVHWLSKSLWLFLFGVILAPLGWVFLRNKWALLPTWALVAAGEVFLIVGMTYRCIIRERPPVSTLYETFLLVTAGGVLVAMIAEVMTRRRIALPVAAVFGAGGLQFAGWYEFTKGEDTMPQLQAVLDTNFYLSIHVTTVTLGYMASLLAGAIGAIYLVGRLFSDNGPVFRVIGRLVYGVLCLGLLLSTFGTIMGGVWANDSWGRFWGWDPKENGALMIVLWQLLILHLRMGGYIRNWGMSMLAVFGNIIVFYSWLGVNLMAVGLHSYGFDAELDSVVTRFYWVHRILLVVGLVAWFLMRERSRAADRQRELEAAGASA